MLVRKPSGHPRGFFFVLIQSVMSSHAVGKQTKKILMLKTKFVQPYTQAPGYMRRLTTFPARAKAGVYLIKEGKDIVYIGHSRTDVYKTMYRHFQEWTHREQEVTTYAGQDLDKYTVRVIYCTAKQAEAAEKYLIKRHKPRDNKYKYESIILLP
jgi:hypothetical protein